MAPEYPLAPEANYKDIVESIRDFLNWYKEDGCFESDYTSLTRWLHDQDKLKGKHFTIDKDRVYV